MSCYGIIVPKFFGFFMFRCVVIHFRVLLPQTKMDHQDSGRTHVKGGGDVDCRFVVPPSPRAFPKGFYFVVLVVSEGL